MDAKELVEKLKAHGVTAKISKEHKTPDGRMYWIAEFKEDLKVSEIASIARDMTLIIDVGTGLYDNPRYDIFEF